MLRSSVVTSSILAAVLVATAACRVEVHTQTQFEDSAAPPIQATRDWAGESITITNDGINPLGGTGGVEVIVSPTATRIAASAVFAAHADDDKRSEADASIQDARSTFAIDETNGFTVRCGHGGSHGSSSAAGSGCKILRVTIPAGAAGHPLDLTVGNGNGDIRVGLAEVGAAPLVSRVNVDNNGTGDVDVRFAPAKGSTLIVNGKNAVTVRVPSTFSSQRVVLEVETDDQAEYAARVNADAFPGMVSGSPFPPSGATADAAAELNVTSSGLLDDDVVSVLPF